MSLTEHFSTNENWILIGVTSIYIPYKIPKMPKCQNQPKFSGTIEF